MESRVGCFLKDGVDSSCLLAFVFKTGKIKSCCQAAGKDAVGKGMVVQGEGRGFPKHCSRVTQRDRMGRSTLAAGGKAEPAGPRGSMWINMGAGPCRNALPTGSIF